MFYAQYPTYQKGKEQPPTVAFCTGGHPYQRILGCHDQQGNGPFALRAQIRLPEADVNKANVEREGQHEVIDVFKGTDHAESGIKQEGNKCPEGYFFMVLGKEAEHHMTPVQLADRQEVQRSKKQGQVSCK